jgi:hypothetical protein
MMVVELECSVSGKVTVRDAVARKKSLCNSTNVMKSVDNDEFHKNEC